MAFSNFVKKRSNRVAVYSFIVNAALLFMLVVMLIVPIPDNPPIYHYPFMVYIPYSLTFNFLLFIIAGTNLRKNNGKFKRMSDNWIFMVKLSERFQWKVEYPLWQKIIRIASSIFLFGAVIAFFLIGFTAPLFFFSPMNMFFLPFVFCALAVWISFGLKKENIVIALWLFLLLLVYITLFISALFIAQDTMILFLTTSYQFIALALILIRLIYYVFFERKK